MALRQHLQRRLLVAEPARLEDFPTARIEPVQRVVQPVAALFAPIVGLQRIRRIASGSGQVQRGRIAGLVIGLRRRIEAHVLAGQTLFHLAHIPGGDPEVPGDQFPLGAREPAQVALRAAQVEEELPLGLGRGHLHQPPVAQHVLMDLGANPVHREGHQSHAHFRVEALDGLHEAHVAFLDQVAKRQAIAQVAAGDVDHEAQLGHHELASGFEVILVSQAARQPDLVVLAQHRYLAHGIDVGIETAHGSGQQRTGQQRASDGQRPGIRRGIGSQRKCSSHHVPPEAMLALGHFEC